MDLRGTPRRFPFSANCYKLCEMKIYQNFIKHLSMELNVSCVWEVITLCLWRFCTLHLHCDSFSVNDMQCTGDQLSIKSMTFSAVLWIGIQWLLKIHSPVIPCAYFSLAYIEHFVYTDQRSQNWNLYLDFSLFLTPVPHHKPCIYSCYFNWVSLFYTLPVSTVRVHVLWNHLLILLPYHLPLHNFNHQYAGG